MTIRLLALLVVLCVAAAAPRDAAAQDLFELEVFEFEATGPGTYAIGLHTNGVPQPHPRLEPAGTTHRPVHVSIEVTRGWTDRLDTAVFIQTAPIGASGSGWFAGGHARAKVELFDEPALPFKVALSGEYGINRRSWADELQTLEVTPILEREIGRLSIVLNPSIELVTRGSGGQGLDPSVAISARAGWNLAESVSLAVDYFSRPGTTRHLDLGEPAHHLIFPSVDLDVTSGWTLSVGAGRCVTSSEPWVVRSLVGFRLPG